MSTRNNLFLTTIFICLFFNVSAQENSEKQNKLRFADKIIHSFGLQYNNAFHAKGKFEYMNAPDYTIGAHSCISYGREYIVKYNLTFPFGFGITTEFVAGNRDFMRWKRNPETGRRMYSNSLWYHSLQPFIDYTYFGGQIKASYMYRLNEQITIQPEMGIKLLKYLPHSQGSLQVEIVPDEYGNPVITNGWRWYDLSNEDFPELRRFMPELTVGFNFLFHSKKDPRHSFILGVNGTFGFIDRYVGWQRFTPTDQIDIRMRYGSSFLAVNMGYEFTGFKKPLHKTKAYKKERNSYLQYETFDFSKPVHSFGFYFTSGFSFAPRIKEAQGKFRPMFNSSDYVPEFNLRYSLAVKNGVGFTVEIPVGFFQRHNSYHLWGLIPNDMVWADGQATGAGYPNSGGVAVPYMGATLKFSYLAQIHRNVFIQPEAGIKFMPYIFPLKSWEPENPMPAHIFYVDNDGQETNVLWLIDQPSISVKHYAVPDITLALNFIVHGKNPAHNFIFGINANIGWQDRLSFSYQTTNALPAHLQSSGKYGWKSSYVGFHVGYQFMKGKKREKM